MHRYARRGCLRCGAGLRAATILLPFATLTASATALLSASRHCGASRLRARPLRRWCAPPTLAPRRRRFAASRSRATSLVVGQGSSRALSRPCPPPRLRRCASSCRASPRGRCRSGSLRRALSPPLCRSSSAPPWCPPRPTFRRSSSLGGGSLARLRLGSRLSVAAPPRANAVVVLLRQRSVANPLRPRNFGGTRSQDDIGGVFCFSRTAFAMLYNAERVFRGRLNRGGLFKTLNLYLDKTHVRVYNEQAFDG